MKRFYILLTAILCFSIAAKAQLGGGTTVVGKISGTVIDSITKKPLDYATVAVFRSGGKVPLNGVLTDEKGNFKLNDMKIGKYKITITFIGYPAKTIDPVITTPQKPDFNMGTIVVAPSGKTLQTININSAAPIIETKIDKIVFNAEKDITSTGGNASDVLRKVPLVNVDINGNVSLRGDQNVKVLINGKPSGAMANNLADVLKSIPADQIKTVEVITSPSAKYDAEGSAGIINIVTKQSNISGISGSVSGGVGTRQNNGNANLNINKNRLSITGNFGGNFTWPQTSSTVSGTDFDANDYTHSTSSTKITRYGYRGSGSLSYDFNSFNSFNSNIALNQGGFKGVGNSNSVTSVGPPSASTLSVTNYLSTSNTNTTFGGFDWNNDYVHKFKKDGHQIDIAGEWSHGITDFKSTSLYTTTNYNDQRSLNNGANNEYTLQGDYTLPVNDKFKIEAGGKTIIRRLTSVYDTYTGSSTDLNVDANTFGYNSSLSNTYDYNQEIYAGYGVLTFTLPKSYSLQVGSRLENTQIHGDPTNAGVLNSFDNSYNVFIPTLAISKTIKNSTYKLTYTKRIQRPSLTYLNPYRNESNPIAVTVGNPQLQPEISQYTELNYSTYIGSSVINLSGYYKYTNNLIEGLGTPFTKTVTVGSTTNTINGTVTQYENIGSNSSFGASFFGAITPISILTIRGSVNAYTYSPTPNGYYSTYATDQNTYVSLNAFLSGSVNLKGGWAAESFVILNTPKHTIQGTVPSFSLWIVGVKKEFWHKQASLGLNTFDPFTENKAFNSKSTGPGYTQFSNTEFPFRSFGISFSYHFGKVTFSDPNDPTQQKKKGVNNDDLKSEGSSGPSGR